MRKVALSLVLVLLFTSAVFLHAQQFDAGLGFGSISAPAATNGFPSESGGLYMSFSGNLLLWMNHHLGFGGEELLEFFLDERDLTLKVSRIQAVLVDGP